MRLAGCAAVYTRIPGTTSPATTSAAAMPNTHRSRFVRSSLPGRTEDRHSLNMLTGIAPDSRFRGLAATPRRVGGRVGMWHEPAHVDVEPAAVAQRVPEQPVVRACQSEGPGQIGLVRLQHAGDLVERLQCRAELRLVVAD